MPEQEEVGSAVLRLSTSDEELIKGILKAKAEAQALKVKFDETQDSLQHRFSEKFEHVGVHLFGHDMLEAVGITEGARPVLGALQLGVSSLASAFGLAGGTVGLFVFGLAAVAAVYTRLKPEHAAQNQMLKDQMEAAGGLVDKLEAYKNVTGALPPKLQELLDAERKLYEFRNSDAIAAAKKQQDANEKEISTLLAKKNTYTGLNAITMAHSAFTKEDQEQIDRLTTSNKALSVELEYLKNGYTGATQAVDAGMKASKDWADWQEKVAATVRAMAKKQADALREAATGADDFALKSQEAVARAARGTLIEAGESYDALLAKAQQASRKATQAANLAYSEAMAGELEAAQSARRLAGSYAKDAENLSQRAIAAQQQLQSSIQGLQNQTASSIGGMTAQLAMGKMAFEDFTKKVLLDITLMIAKIEILRALGTGLGGSFASGFVGGFGGAFAEGGDVSAGRPILVGERGPELFVPRSSGMIVPNNQLAGGGSGVVQNFNMQGMDLSSADAVRRIFRVAAAQARAGATEMLDFARAVSDRNTLQPRRAYG